MRHVTKVVDMKDLQCWPAKDTITNGKLMRLMAKTSPQSNPPTIAPTNKHYNNHASISSLTLLDNE